MSSHIVEVCTINKVEKHPNADRLDIVTVKGWQCVTGNGEYKEGDKCIYIPIDSLLSEPAQEKLFPPDSKIKPSRGRIKTIKIRGAISQGMVIKPELFNADHCAVGSNVAELVGVSKYEPPEAKQSAYTRGNQVSHKQVNPNFHKYTDIENYKNFPMIFKDTDNVSVTEKVHGTNFRCGWVKTVPNTLWKKVKKFFGRLPKYEFVYGSRNVQLQDKLNAKTYYAENVYAKIVEKHNLKTILENAVELYGNEVVLYGEIYGDGIQKNYNYGCITGEQKLVVFDVMVGGCYLGWDDFQKFLDHYHLPRVPQLYTGPFILSHINSLVRGPSVLAPSQPIREGVVVKPLIETTTYMGRKVLKMINDDYLLKADTTEAH